MNRVFQRGSIHDSHRHPNQGQYRGHADYDGQHRSQHRVPMHNALTKHIENNTGNKNQTYRRRAGREQRD